MKMIAIPLVPLFLLGCTPKSPTDSMVDTATQTIDTMYDAIPVECRNNTLENLRTTSKEQIKSINDACQLQKDALRSKIREKNTIIVSLSVLIALYVGAKLFLKLRP